METEMEGGMETQMEIEMEGGGIRENDGRAAEGVVGVRILLPKQFPVNPKSNVFGKSDKVIKSNKDLREGQNVHRHVLNEDSTGSSINLMTEARPVRGLKWLACLPHHWNDCKIGQRLFGLPACNIQ